MERITRDQQLHNNYKDNLKKESIDVYGTVKCWASHKPYKGLIASHIKPYKLCVLDNDVYSEFNTNNGLLLSKTIDDYFDKLLITFDDSGRIVCSEKVPNEIKEEFSLYHLDEEIFNEERKRYMHIHRCLFYYKHFYSQSDIPANLRLDSIQIPYFDCGIKYYENNFIVKRGLYWHICPQEKLKQEFVTRTNYKFKYYISNADLANILSTKEEYKVCYDNSLLNTPNATIGVEKPTRETQDNSFKISVTNYDVVTTTPLGFLSFIKKIFESDAIIAVFRKIVNLALQGKGYTKGVILYGDMQNIELLISILKEVLGTYLYEINDTKVLYKKSVAQDVPNCDILLFPNHNSHIDQHNWDLIVRNSLFMPTPLNVNQYIPFVTIFSNKPIPLQNVVKIKINATTNLFDIKDIISQECGAILNWLINNEDISLDEFEEVVQEDKLLIKDVVINEWLYNNCLFGDGIKTEEKASSLYQDYLTFIKGRDEIPVSARYFFLQLNKIFEKKRYSYGMAYLRIKIKDVGKKNVF